MKLSTPWLCMLALTQAAPVFAGAGLDAYRLGNYARAAELLPSEVNDPVVDYYLGTMRLYGYGELKNNTLAIRYFKDAANKGLLPAIQLMARYTLLEENNPEAALVWFKKAAEKQDVSAQMYCAAAYLFGLGASKNPDVARRYYIMAARAGNVKAQVALAENFLESRQATNKKMGLIWLEKALAAKDPKAQTVMAELAMEGTVVPLDRDRAKALLTAAIAQHYAPATAMMEKLSSLDMSGNEKVVDKETVNVSAKNQSTQTREEQVAAWLTYGKTTQLMYTEYQPSGIFSDWRNTSALKENTYNQPPQMEHVEKKILFTPKLSMIQADVIPLSEYYDAYITSLGELPTDTAALPDYATAENLPTTEAAVMALRSRADVGDSLAQFDVARCYQEGIGVSKDMQQAIHYYTLAAAQQDLRAEYMLGMLYLYGTDVSQNNSEALVRLNNAAFKGNVYAQYALAHILEQGLRDPSGTWLVQPDRDQAIALYELAAVSHFPLAQYRLAEILAHDKPADLSMETKNKRYALIKSLYQGAVDGDIAAAALPLAFFNAMSSDQAKQKAAFDVAEREAKAGSMGAALLLGAMYSRGLGVEKNEDKAMEWYEKASSNPVGAFTLGSYLVREKDPVKGRSLLQQSADANFSYANLNLAALKQAAGEAFLPELEKAHALGNSTAGLLLADHYVSTAQDDTALKIARDIYQRFADQGDKDGQMKLAAMLEEGIGGPIDYMGAEKWYRASAEQGHIMAQYFLGRMYQLSRVSAFPDYQEAKKWYTLAADAHFSPAAVALGFLYDTVDAGYQPASFYYQMAVEKNDPVAQFDLGLIYEKGKGRAIDQEVARGLYEKAALQGHRQSMVQLAGIYFNGNAGIRNQEQALYWYKKAAELHDPDALYQLGLLSATGVDMPISYVNAEKYYQAASKEGNAKATMALARMYQYGLGVAKNTTEAIHLYETLAANKNPYAQYQLAVMCCDTNSDAKKLAEGKQWLQKAEQNGSHQAAKMLQWLNAHTGEQTSYLESITFHYNDGSA